MSYKLTNNKQRDWMTMDFVRVFKFLIEKFKQKKIDFALIGGFALYSAGINRATQDIDMLIPKEKAEEVKKLMVVQGYKLLYESEDVLNFISSDSKLGRVDFVYAYRKYACEMLRRASPKEILKSRFKVKIVRIEDLIGLKIQSSSNDSRRYHQDMNDIESLIENNYSALNMKLVKEYFDLFDREKELTAILKRIKKC